MNQLVFVVLEAILLIPTAIFSENIIESDPAALTPEEVEEINGNNL